MVLWENYQDRKAAAFLDLYESKVKELVCSLCASQENGYKTDVRWAAFSDANNSGLLVVSDNLKGLGIGGTAHAK